MLLIELKFQISHIEKKVMSKLRCIGELTIFVSRRSGQPLEANWRTKMFYIEEVRSHS